MPGCCLRRPKFDDTRVRTARARARGCCSAACACSPVRATPRPRPANWPSTPVSTWPRSATTSATRRGCTAPCSPSPRACRAPPLRQGDSVRLCMKLHFREMLEPTGLWADDATAHGIRPLHEALLRMLARHFGLPAADDEIRRLAVCIAGLGVHLHVGR